MDLFQIRVVGTQPPDMVTLRVTIISRYQSTLPQYPWTLQGILEVARRKGVVTPAAHAEYTDDDEAASRGEDWPILEISQLETGNHPPPAEWSAEPDQPLPPFDELPYGVIRVRIDDRPLVAALRPGMSWETSVCDEG